jgi:hypothetical protein
MHTTAGQSEKKIKYFDAQEKAPSYYTRGAKNRITSRLSLAHLAYKK